MINLVSADTSQQPTQQFNKLYLTPFYRVSLSANTNVTYNVTVNPPDKISNVLGSILSFNVQANGQTQVFTLWVNNKSCNNPSYSIATAFSTTGQLQFYFDCSNIINKSGIYQITLKSDVNTGAISGWLDLTYMNNPSGSMTIHGTEYTFGQIAKVWLQLLDNNRTAITDGVCYTDIYSPDNTYYLERATMTNMVRDGIYFYDLTVPIIEGVYPTIATCYYTAGETNNFPASITMINGTLDTGTITDMQVLDGIYAKTTENALSLGNPRRYWSELNFTSTMCKNISESLLTGVSIKWTGKWNSNLGNDDMTILIYNYTSASWIPLPNVILGSSPASVKSVSNSFALNNITKAGFISGTSPLRLKFNDTALADTSSSGFDYDYLSVSCDQLSNPQWQEVKGSSELHITSDVGFIEEFQTSSYSMNNTQSTTLVNGTTINETYYTGIFNHKFSISASITSNDNLIEYQGLHSIPCNSIISFYKINATGYYTYPYTTQRQTTEDHCSINFILNMTAGQTYDFEAHARNVWESDLRTTNTALGSIYPLLDGGCKLWQIVKGYPDYIVPKNQTNEGKDYYYRACGNMYDNYYYFNKTYQQALTDKLLIDNEQTYLQYESDYYSTKFAEDKLNTVNNLQAVNDYSKLLIDNPLGDGVVNTSDQRYWADKSTLYQAWKIVNASCGTGTCLVNGSSITLDYNTISSNIWNATNRNLTFYPGQVDMTNYSRISNLTASDVWNYSGMINPNIISQFVNSIWAFTSTISVNILEQISNSVWNNTNRNLTYYPTASYMINYSEIANVVWNAAIRNLTEYPTQIDLTNYTLVSDYVWAHSTRNLTFYEDATNYSQIVIGVWDAADRNLTYYPAQIDMTNYTLITQDVVGNVWNATDRNLTFYPTSIDLTNYTEIANVVWNANSRNLTYYENFGDQTNYTAIIVGVWNATTRNLTYYPAQVDLTNYTLITQDVVGNVWNATDRNLTFYPTAVDMTNYTQIADTVWNANNRNLTYTEDVTDYSRIIVGVWNATDRNLTFYPVQIDMTNYTLIGEMVANSSINYTLIADNVWQWNGVILQNILNQISSTTAQNVWNATDRNLTFYPTQVDLTNYTLIQESVWQNLNRTLTDFNFTIDVNNTAIADAVWQSVDRTLTDFNFTVNATMEANNTAIADAVWNAVNRTLTDYNQTDVTDYNKIQQMVWNATDRNLTYYQNFGDQTNYTLMADVVWNATQRTLTELNLTVDINNTAIANAVWASVNRSLTYYNQSDLTDYNLIQTMVWNATIRTLTDFNISVNVTVDTSGIAGAVWNYSNRTVQSSGSVGSVDNVSVVESIKNLGVTFIGGTEYNAGDDGKIAIRLIRGTGDLAEIENGADCKVSIVKPDNSLLINNVSMTPLSPGTQGVYTYDFNVPSTLGIYPYYTNCNVSTRNYYSLNSFHVYAGNNLTAQDVWAAPTRDLTYYPTTNISLTNESIQELGNAVWAYNGTISPNILTQFSNSIVCAIQNIQTDLNLKWGVHINSC
jgi:hypothetical protein